MDVSDYDSGDCGNGDGNITGSDQLSMSDNTAWFSEVVFTPSKLPCSVWMGHVELLINTK